MIKITFAKSTQFYLFLPGTQAELSLLKGSCISILSVICICRESEKCENNQPGDYCFQITTFFLVFFLVNIDTPTSSFPFHGLAPFDSGLVFALNCTGGALLLSYLSLWCVYCEHSIGLLASLPSLKMKKKNDFYHTSKKFSLKIYFAPLV